MKKTLSICTRLLGISILVFTVLHFMELDMSSVWNSWGRQPNGQMILPDWRYLSLIWFKLCIYFVPPFFFAIAATQANKDNVKKNIWWFYLIKNLNGWFLFLLLIKLFFESILEVDKIFGFTMFNSIEDIQVLSGYIITAILHKNIKIEPGETNREAIEKHLK